MDIDRDGDLDYIFLLGGSLFIKYSHEKDISSPIDTTIITITLDTTLLPSAPNYFHELVASPGQIDISFTPARASDRSFRLEFYDRYKEFDQIKIKNAETGDTPRTVIDMMTVLKVREIS